MNQAEAKNLPHVVTIQPAFLAKEDAAAYLSISTSTLEALVAAGDAPRPRKVSTKRTAWLVEELAVWARNRPVSDMLPPANSGHGRAGKPKQLR